MPRNLEISRMLLKRWKKKNVDVLWALFVRLRQYATFGLHFKRTRDTL
jgi:hypothetical protein